MAICEKNEMLDLIKHFPAKNKEKPHRSSVQTCCIAYSNAGLISLYSFFRGLWNVPHIAECYLIKGSLLKKGVDFNGESNKIDGEKQPSNHYPSYRPLKGSSLDPDMAFSTSLRNNQIFMYVSNVEDFGRLMNSEPYETNHKHNDLYEIINNQLEWEERYIHENYSKVLKDDYSIDQPCPDVYWFPVVTPVYCRELIEEMENFGKWSDGSSYVSKQNWKPFIKL